MFTNPQVASRRVTQGTAVLLILAGFFGKLTAVLASIPDPVIGGVLGVLTGTDIISAKEIHKHGNMLNLCTCRALISV